MPDIRDAQNNFTSGVLSPSVYGRVDVQKYASGCKQIKNCVVKAHGGVSNRPGTKYVDTMTEPGRLIDFTYSVEQAYALLFMDKKMRIYKDGGVVVYPSGPNAGEIVEIVTPYEYEDVLIMTFAQSADVMFMAHPTYAPYKLTRTDHHLWTFALVTFNPVQATPLIPVVTPSGFSGGSADTIDYRISAIGEDGEESYPSPIATAVTVTPWNAGAIVDITWASVTDAVRYNVYKNSRGYWGWIGDTEDLAFKDDFIEEDSADGPKEARDPFSGVDDYPGVVGIYQQRLWYGRTNNNPQTVWGSQTGYLNNFSVSYPLKATDAVEAIADSLQMNEIRHFFPLTNVMVLTSGAEIMMSSGRNSDGITPTGALFFDMQSYWGVAQIPPLVAGNNILTVQNSGNIVRDLFYQLANDGYVGSELSILSPDLLLSPIIDWTYQNEPYHTVYAVREDGKMLSLTYIREQEVYAWSLMETDGLYKSVVSIRNLKQDDVYFHTLRDGAYYVEYQKITQQNAEKEDSFFVDNGATYDGVPTDTVTALWLAGKDVSILADGSAITDQTADVTGKVTLDREYSKIHMGLPYTSLVETLDPEINDGKGFTGGKTKSVSKLYFNVVNTINIDAGYIDEQGVAQWSLIKFPQPDVWGETSPLVNGYFPAAIQPSYRTQATIAFRQTLPLPMNVLSVVSEISLGDK